MQVSQMWLCCPSTLSPEVGPSVVSDAGEPASPSAAAAARTITVAGILNPSFIQIGTNRTARIGIVPKDVPIPMVINRPIKSISVAAIILFVISGRTAFTKVSIPPVAFNTAANPAATSITRK